jgi:hypothetical protein
MLSGQEYDEHASIHDDTTARKLGFKGGAIEGPTHFSQFAPLGVALWGNEFLATGALCAHYRNPVVEGEDVRAFMSRPPQGSKQADIRMIKRDGTEVLRGAATVGLAPVPSPLELRLQGLTPLREPVILRDLRVGQRTTRMTVSMGPRQHMGALYPFSLADKLKVITEPSAWYEHADASPWGRAVIPFEMVSVLLHHVALLDGFEVRGPAVGLFVDQEVRMIEGPLLVGENYELEREIVALSASRRTESHWVRTRVYRPTMMAPIAEMLLNLATLKDSYADYSLEYTRLYGDKN